MKESGRKVGIASIPLYFSAMNLALFCGMLRYLSGRQKMAWDVTPRKEDAQMIPVAPEAGMKTLGKE